MGARNRGDGGGEERDGAEGVRGRSVAREAQDGSAAGWCAEGAEERDRRVGTEHGGCCEALGAAPERRVHGLARGHGRAHGEVQRVRARRGQREGARERWSRLREL